MSNVTYYLAYVPGSPEPVGAFRQQIVDGVHVDENMAADGSWHATHFLSVRRLNLDDSDIELKSASVHEVNKFAARLRGERS